MRKINKILVYTYAAALLPFLFFAGCSSSSIYSGEIPNDFKVVAVTGGIAPDQSTLKLEIDGQGNCIYYESIGKDRAVGIFKQIETFKIPPVGLHFIYESIKENNFFALLPEYKKTSVIDGNFAQLSVIVDKRAHTVRTQNIKVPRFDKIMIVINLATPNMDKVIYNQINWFDPERK